MKKTAIALGILERELVRQIIKLAAEGPLAQPKPMQPVKPNTAEKVVAPIKPIAQMGKGPAAPAGRSMFDRQGNGDAQARAAIYDKTKQLGSHIYNAPSRLGDYVGSMLPAAKPGNSGYGNKPSTYAYGPGGGKGPSLSDVTDVAQGFVSGTGQGVKNMAGGVYNFGSGVATSAYHTPLAAAGILGQGIGHTTDALGLTNGAGHAADKYTEHHLDSFWSGASDAANSFGQYAGVRGAPTAVADLNARRNSTSSPAAPQAPGPGQNPAAYGAAPPQGPMGTGVPGPGQNPAAYGAAPPQGPMGPATPAAPTIPPFTPSAEMQQFMKDNNIQSAADLGNLTEQQQLQFNDLYEKQQQQPPAAPTSPPGANPAAWGAAPPQGPVSSSGQPAPQTQQPAQPATQTPEQQNVPDSVKAWGGSLPDHATPEQREQANQAQQQLGAMEPKQKQELATAVNDPKSPEAQKVTANGANNYVSETAADPNNPMPKNDPVAAGNWMSNALNTFHQMPFHAQLLIGAGLSVGVVSMLSSMMGGGGMGGMMLGALGLGAAGMMGASGGMFGNDAKSWVNDAFSGLVTAFGGNVPNEGDIRTRLETAAKQGPEQAKAELEKIRGEVKPYAGFSQDAGKFLTDSANPNFMYDQAHQYATNNYAKLVDERMQTPKTWRDRAGSILGVTGEAANTPGTWSHYLAGNKEDNIKNELDSRGFVKQYSVNVMRKAARCWAGYEPVPGTKAYTEGSCRPKGSKKTKKEVIQGKNHSEKKAGGPGTGSFTLGSHQSPAAVTYGSPMSPDMVNTVRGILQKHPRYRSSNLEDPATVHRAALSMMKLKNAPNASSGAADAINDMHNAGIPGLNGFPAPPVKPNPAVAAAPAQQAMPAQRPQPAPQPNCPNGRCPPTVPRPAPTPQQAPPQPRRDGRPTMTQKPPQTTATGAGQPPVSSIGANGQYQPSVFAKAAPTPQPKPVDFLSGSTPNINGIADQIREYQRLRATERGSIK